MTIDELLEWSKQNWGADKPTIGAIVVRMNVMLGDIARQARAEAEGFNPDEEEVAKEIGNFILSSIRWAHDLGLDPEGCVNLAKTAQESYVERRKEKRSD